MVSSANHPELVFKPHNLQSNQIATPQSVALWEAASNADTKKVKTHLAAGGSPNWYNNPKGGETALHVACKSTHTEASKVVEMLLNEGAVIDVLNLPEFNTPLHFAASKGNLDCVKLLVERPEGPASINKGNSYGNTPLHEASVGGQEAVVSYLIDKGADVNATNKRGSTPLLFALYGDQPERSLINVLIEKGATLTHVDDDGVGVLHISAIKGHEDLLKYFLEKGVVNTEDKNGHKANFYAQIKGHSNLVKLLGGEE